jgi:hypothetical protein
MRATIAMTVGAALALAVSPAPAARAAEEPAPTASPSAAPRLTGRYKFDPQKSDDVREKMREAMANRRRGFGGPGGGGPGGGGPGGGGGGWGGGGGGMGGGGFGGGGMGRHHGPGREGGDDQRGAMRQAMEEATDPGEVLTITEKGPEVTIAYDDGRVRQLFTDGRKIDGEDAERESRWEGDKLVSETTLKKGPKLKIREAYSIDPVTHALRATVRLEVPMADEPVIVHRIYEVAPIEGEGVTVTPEDAGSTKVERQPPPAP